jgi:hypothetical protein
VKILANKLVNLKITEVSGVDRAANKRQFLVMKRADDNPAMKGGEPLNENQQKETLWTMVKSIFTKGEDGTGARDFNETLGDRKAQEIERERWDKLWEASSALREAIDSICRDEEVTDKQTAVSVVLNQFFNYLIVDGVVKREEVDAEIEKAGRKISANRLKTLKDMQGILAGLISEAETSEPEEDETTKGVKKNMETKDQNQTVPEDIMKRLDVLEKKAAKVDELEKQLTEANENVQKAEQDKKDAEDVQLTKQFIEKAASYKNLAVDSEKLGPVMKKLAEVAPEEFSQIEGVLKAADEAIAKGDLFSESGSSAGGNSAGAWDKIVAKGEEIAKRDSISKEKGISKAIQENPDLYAEHLKETRG